MGESLLLITIITLVVLTVRRAKPVVLENPVTIHRPGKYHITFAPRLNRAKNFVERITAQLGEGVHALSDSESQYFSVHDEAVSVPGDQHYLLAVTLRSGMLYFQATNPKSGEGDALVLSNFATHVMAQHPPAQSLETRSAEVLREAVTSVAQIMAIQVQRLS